MSGDLAILLVNTRRNSMRADIVPGATFPDYELTDHTKTQRRLSELQGIDPMILILERGHYCTRDHQKHLELAAFYSKIADAYTQLVPFSIAAPRCRERRVRGKWD